MLLDVKRRITTLRAPDGSNKIACLPRDKKWWVDLSTYRHTVSKEKSKNNVIKTPDQTWNTNLNGLKPGKWMNLQSFKGWFGCQLQGHFLPFSIPPKKVCAGCWGQEAQSQIAVETKIPAMCTNVCQRKWKFISSGMQCTLMSQSFVTRCVIWLNKQELRSNIRM